MRYFYEKEKLTNPEVTKDDFRHLGEKPSSKETVILMFADALEHVEQDFNMKMLMKKKYLI